MAFTIKLYNVSDDPRKLNKTLTGEAEVKNVRPTDIVDLMNPSFILDYNENYTTKNYLWAAAPFNRFYFITDMMIDIGKKIVISCSADVLYTYRADIERINANIVRSESEKEHYLPDPDYKVLSGFQNFTEPFLNPVDSFQSGYYVLSYIGGPNNDNYIEVTAEPDDWADNWGSYYIYRVNEDQYEALSSVYPSAATAPSFTSVQGVFGQIYRLIT